MSARILPLQQQPVEHPINLLFIFPHLFLNNRSIFLDAWWRTGRVMASTIAATTATRPTARARPTNSGAIPDCASANNFAAISIPTVPTFPMKLVARKRIAPKCEVFFVFQILNFQFFPLTNFFFF